jgi:hypothetical protein
MKWATKCACALMLAAAFFAGNATQASALPMPSLAVASPALVMPIACKYGSGKCADVKPVHVAPSTNKQGPQDPTVDPDCKAYGNCHDGPNGGPAGGAALKKGTRKTTPVQTSGIKGESKDATHKETIEMRKAGGNAPPDFAKLPAGQLKTH